MSINQGGPAFPNQESPEYNGHRAMYADSGMSLRDYFAGQALTGIMSNPSRCGDDVGMTDRELERNADYAYAQADAMISASDAA